jgi:multicomponent Na+:H+ antiporter subunit C
MLFSMAGVLLFMLGLGGAFLCGHVVRRILALNAAASGVFLLLVARAYRGAGLTPDPVPHALVLTGIVVAVSTTALALVLAVRLSQERNNE